MDGNNRKKREFMKKWYEEHKKDFYSGMGVFLFTVIMLLYALFGTTGQVKAEKQHKEQAKQEESVEKKKPVKKDVSAKEKTVEKDEAEKEEKEDTEKLEEKQEKGEEIKEDKKVEKVAELDVVEEEQQQDKKTEEKQPSSVESAQKPTQKPSQGETTGSGNVSSGNNNHSGSTEKPSTPAQKPQEQPKPQEKPKEPVWHPPVKDKRWVVDQAAWVETVNEPVYSEVGKAICTGCGADITNYIDQHFKESYLNGGNCGGYSVVTEKVQTGTNTYTVNHPEVGHWEEYVVQEGYWE